MQPLLLMLLGLILPPLTTAECPDIDDEPVMYPYDEKLFLCADIYQGPGDYDAMQACNSCEPFGQVYYRNGYAENGTEGQHYPIIGSIIVMPGCTFDGFSDSNFEGEVRQYEGGQVIPYVEELDDCDQTVECDETVYGF